MKFNEFLKKIDPYTYLDIFLEKQFGKPNKLDTKIIYWIFYLFYSFLLAFVIYQLLALILGTSMPLATVVSSSMEPNFSRGDIIILTSPKNLEATKLDINMDIKDKDVSKYIDMNYGINEYGLKEIKEISYNNQNINLKNIYDNDVVVYTSNINGKKIIHRIFAILNANDGTYVITKGDNYKTNRIIDQDCNIDPSLNVPRNNCVYYSAIDVSKLEGKKIGRIPYIGYIKIIFS